MASAILPSPVWWRSSRSSSRVSMIYHSHPPFLPSQTTDSERELQSSKGNGKPQSRNRLKAGLRTASAYDGGDFRGQEEIATRSLPAADQDTAQEGCIVGVEVIMSARRESSFPQPCRHGIIPSWNRSRAMFGTSTPPSARRLNRSLAVIFRTTSR